MTGRVLASPKAKRIAKEQGIELKSLRGSGPEGSILTADVLRAATGTARGAAGRVCADGATNHPAHAHAPHRRPAHDPEQTERAAFLHQHGYRHDGGESSSEAEAKEHGDESIPSINDFILHACARALKNFPSLNSSFTEQGIRQHSEINLGVAVALEEGLVVPVIRNADRLNLNELAQQSRQLADKAQNKKLFPLDYEGGTFTVSNLGMLGVDSFIAIINPPQCAILAVGRVAPRVVADDGMFAIKPMMTATLSADHRVVDGAMAARFLQAIKQSLESPKI